MKVLFLLAIIVLSGIHGISAQALPDTISLSEADIKVAYYSSTDTLGFRQLSSKTSLKEYKKNKSVIRTLRNIKRSLEDNIIFSTIAGSQLSVLQGVDYPDCLHVLRYPKYSLTSKGTVLIGKRDIIAGWNDIASHWETIDCYFVSYNRQQVTLIQSLNVNKRKAIQEGKVSYQVLSYRYLGIEPEDTLSTQKPPVFTEVKGGFEEYLHKNAYYPVPALEMGIRGKSIVAFTVNSDKSVTDIRIVRALDILCDRDVIRLIKSTENKWLPGTINGEEVSVEVMLSATFSLVE